MSLLRDERWPVARLIPIASATGVEARERNAASALLAVISAVEEFGRSLLKPLGAPAGRTEVASWQNSGMALSMLHDQAELSDQGVKR